MKGAVLAKSRELIKKEFLTYSKLKDHDNDEVLNLKDYTINMNLRDARTMFRLRSHMTNVKMNQKSDKRYANELWKCDFCLSLDSQSHIVWCPAFASLREGKNQANDLDLVKYFQAVMKLRERI